MSAQDGGTYFPSEQGHIPDGTWNQTYDPGASCRFELFKAVLQSLYVVGPNGCRADMIVEALGAADAGLRALGLAGDDQDAMCPACDLHRRNCTCPPGGEHAGNLVDAALLASATGAKAEADTLRAQRNAMETKLKQWAAVCVAPENAELLVDFHKRACEALKLGHNVRVQDAVAALRTQRDALATALDLVLPMAKGYAHAHQAGSNAKYVQTAEEALAVIESEKEDGS